MRLQRLQLHDFRNIAQAALEFGPGLNLLAGANGQGKSNLLEAVGLLAAGRSFRRALPAAMRRHGAPAYRVVGECHLRELPHRVEFRGQANRQVVLWDGKPLASASALGQFLGVVVVSSDTLRLVKGEPQERRAYLDWSIFAGHRAHAEVVRGYQKALRSRNRLLRIRADDGQLGAWEEQLARLGAAVAIQRRAAVVRLLGHLGDHLEELGLAGHRCTLALHSQLDKGGEGWDEAAARERLLAQLEGSRSGDRLTGVTSVGPHRDDLVLRMDGRPLSQFGSQGQQKRFVLALKLAEEAVVREALGEPPLVLLDDPAAELDRDGVALLMGLLARGGNQVFLATCEPGFIAWPGPRIRHFAVRSGTFSAVGESLDGPPSGISRPPVSGPPREPAPPG